MAIVDRVALTTLRRLWAKDLMSLSGGTRTIAQAEDMVEDRFRIAGLRSKPLRPESLDLLSIPIGQSKAFSIIRRPSLQAVASKLKRDGRATFETHTEEETVYVRRLS